MKCSATISVGGLVRARSLAMSIACISKHPLANNEPNTIGWKHKRVGRRHHKGARPMTARESAHPIVLSGWESRPQGQGGDGEREPSKDTCAGPVGLAYPSQLP